MSLKMLEWDEEVRERDAAIWNQAVDACAKICEQRVVYYVGTEPVQLVESRSGERFGHLYAAEMRALKR